MFRRDKWWHREIEKIRREHAAREADLIATICHLSGKPLPRTAPAPPHDEPDESLFDLAHVDQLP